MRDILKKGIIGIGTLILVAALLVSGAQIKAEAGFGDFNDYDYDSGSDWDYDYDYDYGYDDYGYDYGYDYGGSRGSGRRASRSDVFFRVIGIIIVFFLIYLRTRLLTQHRSQRRRRQPQRTAPARTQQVVLPDRTTQISKVIREYDPDFTAPDFISFAKKVYVDIQDAWSKRDLEPVRAVLHQNLYQQTERQIEKKIADGIVNYLERISVNTAYLTSYRRDAQYEYLTIYLAASMIDYQVKEATGEVILGDKTTRWNMYYKMTFMRSNDSKTRSAKEKDQGFVCPNCGAPLAGTSFGKCDYCGSVVTTGVYDWVLSDFGVVKNDTKDDGIVIDS